MSQPNPLCVGIDVSKTTLDIATAYIVTGDNNTVIPVPVFFSGFSAQMTFMARKSPVSMCPALMIFRCQRQDY
ncbi:Uncharacterised protein [Escherichia coli]|nr:Uncharacterised protein [Escherichia coli]HCU1564547.1 hypothetical protein [Escherichia coli]